MTGGILKGGFVLQPLPALIGAFIGPLVLARELETGTFRYAWTQGFGRRRWTLANLVLLGVAVTAMAGAFSVLVSWYYQPYLSHGRLYDPTSALPHWLFDLRGLAFAAWTLAALRHRRLRRHAHPAGRPCDRRHARRLYGHRRRCRGRLGAPTTGRPTTSGRSRRLRAAGCSRAVRALLIAATVWLVHRRAA